MKKASARWSIFSSRKEPPFVPLRRRLLASSIDCKRFAAADPSVITQEHKWGTVVHTACIWGQIEILDWLMSQGAIITQASPQGLTPLEIAQNQAKDGRSHTPIVINERKAEIERTCARIVERLREATGP